MGRETWMRWHRSSNSETCPKTFHVDRTGIHAKVVRITRGAVFLLKLTRQRRRVVSAQKSAEGIVACSTGVKARTKHEPWLHRFDDSERSRKTVGCGGDSIT